MAPKLVALALIPDALDAVAEWWNSEDVPEPVPKQRFGHSIEVGDITDVKEFVAKVNDVERIFQCAPNISDYHFYEVLGENLNRLDTVTDHGLQQALVKALKETKNE